MKGQVTSQEQLAQFVNEVCKNSTHTISHNSGFHQEEAYLIEYVEVECNKSEVIEEENPINSPHRICGS